jgi:hypothetical protein
MIKDNLRISKLLPRLYAILLPDLIILAILTSVDPQYSSSADFKEPD